MCLGKEKKKLRMGQRKKIASGIKHTAFGVKYIAFYVKQTAFGVKQIVFGVQHPVRLTVIRVPSSFMW